MSFAQLGTFFSREPRKLAYIATNKVVTYKVNKDVFWNQLDSDPIFSREYLCMCLRNQIFLVDRALCNGEKGVQAKLAHWLLFMAKYYGEKKIGDHEIKIDIPVTQITIANFLNSTRESINSVLSWFIEEGFIKIEKKIITILNSKGLEKYTRYK